MRRQRWLALCSVAIIVLSQLVGVVSPVAAGSGPAPAADVAPAATAVAPLFGVSVKADWSNPVVRDLAVQAGVRWIRSSIYWREHEPTKGSINVSSLDGHFQEIARLGLIPIVYIAGNPDWANPNKALDPNGSGPIRSDAYAEFGVFMRTLAARYNGTTVVNGVTLPKVDYWSLYNEVDNKWCVEYAYYDGCWGGHGAEYAQMLKTAYENIHAVNPDAKLVFGGIAAEKDPLVNGQQIFDFDINMNSNDFVNSVLGTMKNSWNFAYFDIFDVHYYPPFHYIWDVYGPGLAGKVEYYRQRMARWGFDRPILSTESGRASNPERKVDGVAGSDEEQSRFVVRLFAQAMKAGLLALTWYTYIDDAPDWKFGLLTQSTYQTKPSYTAFKTLTQLLGSATYDQALSITGVEGYVFNHPSVGQRSVIWATNGSSANVPFASSSVRTYDKWGTTTLIRDGQSGDQDGAVNGFVWLNVAGSPLYMDGRPVPAPTAEFMAAPTSGIAPLTVQFTNQTTGSTTSYLWNFGDGGTSTVGSPSHVYATPGAYTVTLAATGPGGTTEASKPSYISVAYPAPVAAFVALPASGSAPLVVQFANQTTGNVTSYQWSFGDGGTSTAANPSHTYSAPGAYTVTLTATGPGGADTESRSGYITVGWPPPAPNFTGSPTSGTAPLTVQFTNQTTGNVTGYQWVFGDGDSSTAASPSHTYSTPGAYTVTLTATGPGGAAVAAKTSYIAANHTAPVANFVALTTSGTAPLAVQFTNLTSGNATSYLWSFGDGSSSTVSDPSHTYSTPGAYTVVLTATGPGGSDVESKSSYITVDQAAPVPAFSGSPSSGAAPLVVQFTNQTTGSATSYQWIFGDGGTSTAANPSHTYAAGTYTVTLTATGPGGSAVAVKASYIVVNQPAPVADFTAAPTSGNAPLVVQFSNHTTGNVTSYQWGFGDGGSSTAPNPNHTYTTPGMYTVVLTATGPGGVSVASKPSYIVANDQGPEPDFTASPTSGAIPLAVQFTNQTTGNATSYQWSFGDGGASTAANPSHAYVAAGMYTVTLTATGPGGTAVASKVNYISAGTPAPVASFSGSPRAGVAPLAVQFNNQTAGSVTGYLWSFGDGGTSTASDPSHTYSMPGVYTVTLTATGPGGTSLESQPNYIAVSYSPPSPNFSGSPTSGIAPLAVQFTNQTTGNVTSYQWTFGDGGSSSAANPSHTYAAPGAYTVTLVATGPGGAAAASKPSYISVGYPAPVANFTASRTSGDAPLAVQFNNQTTGNATGYQWAFGDGGSSTVSDPSHTYSTPGVYTVVLTATGPGGSDVESKSSYITVDQAAPVPAFSGSPSSGAAPLTVQFTNQTTGSATSYQWIFGDGGTSSAANPSHTYAAGTYTVTLTATGPGGTAVVVRTSYIIASAGRGYTFDDVPPTHPQWEYVEKVYAHGVTAGCSSSPMLYCPNGTVKREEIAVFLDRALGWPPATEDLNIFGDLAPSYWATPFAVTLYKHGLTAGCQAAGEPLKYCPLKVLSKAEIATMIVRGTGWTLLSPVGLFADVPVGLWSAPFAETFAAHSPGTSCGVDLATGKPLFCPDSLVNRSYMAELLVKSFGW